MGTRPPRGARGGCPCAASCSQGGLEKEEAGRGTKPTLLSPPAQRLGQAGQAEQVERASGGCRGDHHKARLPAQGCRELPGLFGGEQG